MAISFDPNGLLVATGSMDCTAKLWDVEIGKIHSTLKQHDGELVSLHFSSEGDLILTGSFDKTAVIWDARIGEPVHILKGHKK